MGPDVVFAEDGIRPLDPDPIGPLSLGISEEVIPFQVRRQEKAD